MSSRTVLSIGICCTLALAAWTGNVAAETPSAARNAPATDQLPPGQKILDTLHAERPRLLAHASRFEELREKVKSDPVLKQWHAKLTRYADRILEDPPSRYEIPDGKRLLGTSRQVLRRVYLLALLDRLDDKPEYAKRVWRELKAAAEFKDWNPSHFLDTAEMTHAFAIGYDWLHHRWSPEQRRVLRQAIVRHGLKPGLKCYRGEARYGWWVRCEHNWNQVCNGGLLIGALAIADEEPEVAAEIVHGALKSLPLALQHYAPDGAWDEGPGYWYYATDYTVSAFAALTSALGTDFGLSEMPGLSVTGFFPIHMTGTTGVTFNFADGRASPMRPWMMFWLSRRYDHPELAAYEVEHARPLARDMLLYDPRGRDATYTNLPLDAYYRNVEVATFRGAWQDPNAIFLGCQAGDNAANHGHLDLGSFVFEALGQRWIVDMGADNYNLPGYFSGHRRWDYYRLRAEAHNTLVINPDQGPDQDPRARAKIATFDGNVESPRAVLDLTPAYADDAERVVRTLELPRRRELILRDEVVCREPSEVWSLMITPADVRITDGGHAAELTMNGKRLTIELNAPEGARLQLLPAAPLPTSPNPEGQRVNDEYGRLAVRLTDVREATIELRLRPHWED